MALLIRYSKLHAAKYGQRPVFNINVEQWASDGLIESYGMQACYDLLEYYFEVAQSPSWKYFANYAQDIVNKRELFEQDKLERAQRRLAAKKWLSE